MNSTSTIYSTTSATPSSRPRSQRRGKRRRSRGSSLEGVRAAAAADTPPVLELTTWPGGERRRLAHADYHGAWLEWL